MCSLPEPKLEGLSISAKTYGTGPRVELAATANSHVNRVENRAEETFTSWGSDSPQSPLMGGTVDQPQCVTIHDASTGSADEFHGDKNTNMAAPSLSPVQFDEAKVPTNDAQTAENRGMLNKDCIIIQGLPESSASNPRERVAADLEQFQKLLNEMPQPTEAITVLKAFRLGDRTNAAPRPLKIVLGSNEQAKPILSRRFRLKHSQKSYIRQSTQNKDPIPLLRTAEGTEISDDKDKAEHLSQFFRSVVTSEPDFFSPTCEDEETPALEAVSFTKTIVQKGWLNLEESTSPGRRRPPSSNFEQARRLVEALAYALQYKQSSVLCHVDGAHCDERLGIRIGYRTDDHLLNQRRTKALTRLSTTTVHDLLFADDCAPNSTTEVDMQRSTDLFASGCAHFGRTINTDKTVVMHQQWRVRVNGTEITSVNYFNFPGGTTSRYTRIDDEEATGSSKQTKPSAGCRTACGIATTFN
ncbi:hypothetical protein SprV_0301259600 [Sparganum proliferum]